MEIAAGNGDIAGSCDLCIPAIVQLRIAKYPSSAVKVQVEGRHRSLWSKKTDGYFTIVRSQLDDVDSDIALPRLGQQDTGKLHDAVDYPCIQPPAGMIARQVSENMVEATRSSHVEILENGKRVYFHVTAEWRDVRPKAGDSNVLLANRRECVGSADFDIRMRFRMLESPGWAYSPWTASELDKTAGAGNEDEMMPSCSSAWRLWSPSRPSGRPSLSHI
nr:hypothetical protein [Rhizobium lentis]